MCLGEPVEDQAGLGVGGVHAVEGGEGGAGGGFGGTLTKSLASGLGQYGITVNDVSPGFIETVRDMETRPRCTTG